MAICAARWGRAEGAVLFLANWVVEKRRSHVGFKSVHKVHDRRCVIFGKRRISLCPTAFVDGLTFSWVFQNQYLAILTAGHLGNITARQITHLKVTEGAHELRGQERLGGKKLQVLKETYYPLATILKES